MVAQKRIVITGLGAVTPLAVGVGPSWQALCAGRSGTGPITLFDAGNHKCQVAGEVKDFHPEDFMEKKLIGRMDRFIHFALAAARMAVEDSGLKIDPSNEERIGVIIGTSAGGPATLEKGHALVVQGALSQVSPFGTPSYIANMATGQVTIQFHARGPQLTPVGACAAGTQAIGEAARYIRDGMADAVIAGGAEAGITATIFAMLDALRAITCTRNSQPEKASRPFDKNRDGFVASEGSGIVVVEALESALERGARIYGELIGYGLNSDAYHIVAPSPDGAGPARCISLALRSAGIAPEEVDYINAHGTSTVLNDKSETTAVKSVFGEHARKLALSSNKSMVGHMWGASGTVEAIFTLLSMRDGIIPPTINYETPDPECDLDYVPNVARKADIRIAMSNSFGFGGINASVVFKKYVG
ncbi:MAG: beta-ketoacyl-ACP synthase II [Chloroflexi bacterium]|nr:beta-ketoacyl-ACP synthase II [Chloroflexota bacterium]